MKSRWLRSQFSFMCFLRVYFELCADLIWLTDDENEIYQQVRHAMRVKYDSRPTVTRSVRLMWISQHNSAERWPQYVQDWFSRFKTSDRKVHRSTAMSMWITRPTAVAGRRALACNRCPLSIGARRYYRVVDIILIVDDVCESTKTLALVAHVPPPTVREIRESCGLS